MVAIPELPIMDRNSRVARRAWNEMTKVCANLLGGISRSLKQNAEWHMELLDESKQPVFPNPPRGGIAGLNNSIAPARGVPLPANIVQFTVFLRGGS